jgi:hypothetical protein
VACAFCGEGDKWIKTCRTRDRSRILVCDPCWEVLTPKVVIVPGDGVVTARCDGCSAYVVNRRAMAKFSSGGHYNTYSGRCGACAGEGARETVGVATRSDYEGEERP